MPKKRFTRRQMLRGAGGVAVGLPFLPSLVPGPAYAQEATLPPQKRFFSMCTTHGGVNDSAMFPSESMLTEQKELYTGHQIWRGALQRTAANGRAQVSEILSGADDVLTDDLVSKMNVFMGLDVPFYIGHHTGGHLGNYARNDGNSSDGKGIQSKAMPTVDQLMAHAPAFYEDLAGVTARSVACGNSRRYSYGYSTPGDPSSPVVENFTYTEPGPLFDYLFPNPAQASDNAEAPRPSIVDRVIASYRNLRDANRRLSADDRQRLEDHMARLQELDRRLNATLSCALPDRPGQVQGGAARCELMVDVIAAAMICGATRIAVLSPRQESFVDYVGDWHQDVAHQFHQAAGQALLREANQATFERLFLRLAAALNVEDRPGHTVLDDSLLSWSQECGSVTHHSISQPVITFGGAAGTWKTGQFLDYRNRNAVWKAKDLTTGITYNQYLANLLMTMGVANDTWSSVTHNGETGYGIGLVDSTFEMFEVPGVIEGASDWLTWLRA